MNTEIVIVGAGKVQENIQQLIEKIGESVEGTVFIIEDKIPTLNFTIEIPGEYDIVLTEDEKAREHYKKVTAPPPPWKRK